MRVLSRLAIESVQSFNGPNPQYPLPILIDRPNQTRNHCVGIIGDGPVVRELLCPVIELAQTATKGAKPEYSTVILVDRLNIAVTQTVWIAGNIAVVNEISCLTVESI